MNGNDPKMDLSRRKRGRSSMSLYAEGEPMVWLTGGALGLSLLMMLVMLTYVFWMGITNFWPTAIYKVHTLEGETYMGTITREQHYQVPASHRKYFDDLLEFLQEDRPAATEEEERLQVQIEHLLDVHQTNQQALAPLLGEVIEMLREGETLRQLFYTGNYDITGTRFQWVSDFHVLEAEEPEWALLIERLMDGNFYGIPVALLEDGEVVTEDPAEIWKRFSELHPDVRRRYRERERIRTIDMGRTNRREEQARLDLVEGERRFQNGDIDQDALEAIRQASQAKIDVARNEYEVLVTRVDEINAANRKYTLLMETAQGQQHTLLLDAIVRAFPANQLSRGQKIGIFASRWREFLLDNPREANMEGGVYPLIIGTVTMTLVMSLFVVPFGVIAALYLREYAKPGPVVSAVRIAINNLAGVPSIVFGVFGLGFFCYILGGHMDEWFYAARLPAPTFRKGGVLWASLTLALMTLPVVIVATEEALSAVPGSMREGSYACGASKWQTIKRIVLPRAMPGIMTGMILAMARGAGEVAPLMLVGAVKLAPSLPFDLHDWSGSVGPIPTGPVHLERSFLHLGFHIYDLGFQSSDSEAARPMVFTTTLLLITIIVVLNLSAMVIRTRLRKKFQSGAF